jgi:hypothetical protein
VEAVAVKMPVALGAMAVEAKGRYLQEVPQQVGQSIREVEEAADTQQLGEQAALESLSLSTLIPTPSPTPVVV